MDDRIFILLIMPLLIASCEKVNDQVVPGNNALSKQNNNTSWLQGQIVELTGILWPAKSPGGNKYYLRMDSQENPHLISSDIDKLSRGTKVSIKGTVNYVKYERPKNIKPEESCFIYPQTVCYIKVISYKIINP